MDGYKIGDIVSGKVTGVEDYGIFLSFDDNVVGLIHISEISDAFVRKVSDYAEVGEMLEAKIIDIDKDSKKLKLSIKDLPYRKNSQHHKIVETGNGFSGLEDILDVWISEKIEEFEKK